MRVRGVLISVIVALMLAIPTLALALTATLSDIAANPDRYDGQSVTLHGSITNLRERVSRAGNPYYTFDLSDGKRAIRVFSFGAALCRSGIATVDGTFQKVKRQGRYTFY